MGVPGKCRWEWEYRTYCDWGTPGRRSIVATHFSEQAAERQFKRLRKCYSGESLMPERLLYRCWQEDRRGTVIRDTGAMVYAEVR